MTHPAAATYTRCAVLWCTWRTFELTASPWYCPQHQRPHPKGNL